MGCTSDKFKGSKLVLPAESGEWKILENIETSLRMIFNISPVSWYFWDIFWSFIQFVLSTTPLTSTNPGVSFSWLFQCHVSYRHPEKDAEKCFQDVIASIFFIFPDFSLFYHILSILGLPFCTPYLATVIKLNESHAS